ncbi:FAD-binding domain-containing protein [Mucisphaera sp.]|uniref:FAD-binding domain-containing protein n=1 Tax=Mucisphaera sp. TaxID=2913024 RepID=UPI003D13A230
MPTTANNLHSEFNTRDELIQYCNEQFPQAATIDNRASDTSGGLAAANDRLAAINPREYAKTRNFPDGSVTRLSPYLRHGVLSLAQVRDKAIETAGSARGAYKLINELAWRDYWRRVLGNIGNDIWTDLEDHKTGLDASAYTDDLPEDIANAQTGIDFIDLWITELYETGYIHNQSRMKLAAYLVHWRRVSWQTGAAWFLTHLLDADLASNNLSWQWVAGTFSHKPYIFNLENVQKWFGPHLNGRTPQGDNPFDLTYDQLNDRLFP